MENPSAASVFLLFLSYGCPDSFGRNAANEQNAAIDGGPSLRSAGSPSNMAL